MPRKKTEHKLRLNGLDMKISSNNELTIYDKMRNLDNAEARKICEYLVKEGFLETEDVDEIACTIIYS